MSRRRLVRTALSATLVGGVLAAIPAAAHAADPPPPPAPGVDYRYVYIDTPGLHGRALAVSDDRTVVGYSLINATIEQPFVFDEEHGTSSLPLDDGMRHGGATAISRDGHAIGGWEETAAGDCWAVRWTKDSTGAWKIQQLVHHQASDPNFVGCADVPVGVGDDGSVAITTVTPGDTPTSAGGLLWTEGGVSALAGQPRAMGSSGEVVGVVPDGSVGTRPWREVGGALTPPAGAVRSEAVGLARDGTIVVNSDAGAYERQPGGAYLRLHDLPTDAVSPASRVRAISNHGEAVGDSDVAALGGGTLPHAVRWNADGSPTDLNDVTPHDQNETLVTATAVNKDGDIVGGAMSDRTGGLEAPMLLVAMPPIVFIPGVAGSHLVDASGDEQWINCLGVHDDLGLPPDGSTSIYADDVLRDDQCGPFGVLNSDDTRAYAPFVNALEARGLVEYDEAKDPSRWTTAGCDKNQRSRHPNLFLFPYDWRQSNSISAMQLADLIGCVREFYTGPVMVVAHSMGGLVARRYILDHPDDSHHIRDLLTIGTPWLGAPKLIRAEETGDFIPFLMTNSTVKKIIPTMPGPGQLLPSEAYYQLAPAPFAEAGWDINADGVSHQQYNHAQVDALLDSQYANHAAITATANAFHADSTPEGSQDDWRTDKTDVRYTVMYGVHQKTDTPGPVTAVTTVSCVRTPEAHICQATPEFRVTLVRGDGTVPLESATRQGNGLDLNNTDHETLIPVYGSAYGDATTEHTGLTRNAFVQETVLKVDGRTATGAQPAVQTQASPMRSALVAGPTATAPAAPSQWVVDLHGLAGPSTVLAPDGTTDAVVDGAFRPTLPGVSHAVEGAGAELDVLPDGAGTYAVTFTAGTSTAQVDVRRGAQDTPSARDVWTDLEVPAGHIATVTLDASGASLAYDADGDGTVDSTVPPTARPQGYQLEDVAAPELHVGAIVLNGTREFTLTANDDLSGVKSLMWSADGHTFRQYDGPVALDPAAPLFAYAEDFAGNRSGLQTFALTAVPATPFTTATMVPNLPPNGWSTTPVTVHLHARPSDGTTVSSITWSWGWPSHVVAGDTATVQVTEPGGYLFYYATDSSGAKEQVQTLRVGVDSTPPPVSIATPVSGSVAGGLTSVTGNAKENTSGSGVSEVTFDIERNADGTYWDGTSWQGSHSWLATKAGQQWWTGDWQAAAPLPAGADLTAGGYTVHARAVDWAGNAGTALSEFTVTTAAIITPLEAPSDYTGHPTFAFGVNDAGQVAGMAGTGSTSNPPIRWDADGTPHLLGSGFNYYDWPTAWAIDDAGQVAGRLPDQAGMWQPDGTVMRLPGGSPSIQYNRDTAQAISPTGVVAGIAGGWSIWTGGVLRHLPDPTGFSSVIETSGTNVRKVGAINTAGTVVGTRWMNQAGQPGEPVAAMAVQNGGNYTASYLFPPPDSTTRPAASGALGVNTAGDIVGWGGIDRAPDSPGYTSNPPFLRKADGSVTWFDLGALHETCGMATSINDSDVIVGYGGQCGWPYQDLNDHDANRRAWVITGGVVKDLTALLPLGSGWVLNEAWSVSNTGWIAGTGTYNGRQRAFVMSLGAATAVDHAPLAADVSLTTDPDTAAPVTLTATDADHDDLQWTVVDQPSHGSLSPLSGDTVTYTPAPGYTGTDSFTFRAGDGTYQSNLATVTITVGTPAPPLVPPTATLLAPAEAAEGTPFVVDGSDSAGPDGSGPLSYSWDLDGDGVFGDATTATPTVTAPDDGTLQVRLRVSGASGSDETSRVITIVNVAPGVSRLDSASVAAGAAYTARGTFTDPGADQWTGTVDYGDGDGAQPLSLSGKAFDLGHSYSTRGSYTVTVSVCDDDAGCGRQQTRVDVTGGGVVTATGTDVAAVEGAGFSGPVASFRYTDPGAGVAAFGTIIDWGDGSAPAAGVVELEPDGSFGVLGTHTYADEGHYPVTTTITAAGGTGDTATSVATVGDAPLVATGSAALTSPNPVSGLTVATFTDANPSGSVADFSATVDWGDGSSSAGLVTVTSTGSYAVTGDHTYADLGPRTITVAITDAGGSRAQATSQLIVYAVSEGGSFVVGDRAAAVGSDVTFWGSSWWKANPTSGGSAPADFTGFAPGVPPAACGGGWASMPAASSAPPDAIPAYLAVVVTDRVDRSGSVLSGDVIHVVIVKTTPGYAADPGHPGIGTVVGTVC